jgi:glycosyltransferase involved in cell wall biosynthesis
MKKVSVVMASYLGDYPGRASNPEQKFVRAVKSFLTQTYENKELIIVSDGCDVTERLYQFNFSKYSNIKFVKIQKQPTYSGDCRNAGLELADGDVITYLDNDDILGKKHLEIIMEQFDEDLDFVYYDDYLVNSSDFKKLHKRYVEPRYGSIGTSSISHINFNENEKFKNIKWSTGYGHDFTIISSIIINGAKFKKLKTPPQYLVCHYGGGNNRGDF